MNRSIVLIFVILTIFKVRYSSGVGPNKKKGPVDRHQNTHVPGQHERLLVDSTIDSHKDHPDKGVGSHVDTIGSSHTYKMNEMDTLHYSKIEQQGELGASYVERNYWPSSSSIDLETSNIVDQIIDSGLASYFPTHIPGASSDNHGGDESKKYHEFLLKLTEVPPDSSAISNSNGFHNPQARSLNEAHDSISLGFKKLEFLDHLNKHNFEKSLDPDASPIIEGIINSALLSPQSKLDTSNNLYTAEESKKYHEFLSQLTEKSPVHVTVPSNDDSLVQHSYSTNTAESLYPSLQSFEERFTLLTNLYSKRPKVFMEQLLQEFIPVHQLATMTVSGRQNTIAVPKFVCNAVEGYMQEVYGEKVVHEVFMEHLSDYLWRLRKKMNIVKATRKPKINQPFWLEKNTR